MHLLLLFGFEQPSTNCAFQILFVGKCCHECEVWLIFLLFLTFPEAGLWLWEPLSFAAYVWNFRVPLFTISNDYNNIILLLLTDIATNNK